MKQKIPAILAEKKDKNNATISLAKFLYNRTCINFVNY